AALENPEIAKGINILKGKVTYKAVAEAFGLEYWPLESLL
ncbi:MAG TPA: alanine dehydrogenase, partial [Desulfobacteraceae bacterium]|nr:alanine dehydrogenase [Desulfobacteraceae bacterium]